MAADKKAEIKELSLQGHFKEIQEKHGETVCNRAKAYAESKLKTLRELVEAGDSIPAGTSAFLIFALNQAIEDDVDVISKKFHGEATKAKREGSDDGWDSDATGPQTQEKPIQKKEKPVHEEEHNDPPPEDDNVNVNDALEAEDETQAQAQEEIHTQAQEQTEKEAPPAKSAPLPNKVKKGGFQLPSASTKFKPQKPEKAPAEVTPGTKSNADDDDDDDDSSSFPKKLKASRSSSSSIKKVKSSKSDKTKVKTIKKTSKKEKKDKEEKINKSSFENLPKGAKSGYIIFGESERHVIKAENCALPNKMIMQEIGVRWNLLTDGEKAVWNERAAEDKIRYARDYQEYTEEFPEEARRYKAWKAEGGKRGTKKGNDKSENKKRKRSESSSSDGKRKIARKSRVKASRKKFDDEDEDDDADDEQDDDEMDIAVVVNDDDDDAGNDEAEFNENTNRSASSRRVKTTTKKTPGSTPRSRSLSHSTSSVPKTSQKRETNGSSQPPIVVVDHLVDNQRTSKIIAGLKGIKQSDLPKQEDIMQTNVVPVERAPFPADYKPEVGDHAVLILEPYREFVSELPLDFISQEELQLVQAICSLSTATAVCKIIGVRSATSCGHGSNQANATDEDGQENRVPDDALFVKLNIGGDHFTVLYLPFASPLLRTDIFLIDKTAYDKILKAPWMVPNAQIRRPFAPDEEDGLGAEWLEGSIYHVRPDFKKNPYRSISVAWMHLEESPRRWFYAASQASNMCSPWDLSVSKYVLPENIPSIVPLPSSLQGHTVDAMAVLAYLKSVDFSSVFKYKLTTNDEYCEKFPDSDDQLDFHVIDVRCSNGRYKGSNITTLFSDLELMIANGKKFNEENKDFQPWRLCDMMEKKVADLKIRLGNRIVVPSTSSSSSSCGSSSSSSSLLHPNNKKQRTSDNSDNHLISTFDGEAEETADLDALEQEEV